MPEITYIICPDCGTKNFPERTHCLGCVRELGGLPSSPSEFPLYELRDTPTPPASEPVQVFWYRVYCTVLLCLYLVVAPLLLFAASGQPDPFPAPGSMGSPQIDEVLREVENQRRSEMNTKLVIGLGLCGVFALAVGIALALRPTPGAWIYHIVILCLGLTGGCTLPFSVILLILWFQPATLRYFGRYTPPPPPTVP